MSMKEKLKPVKRWENAPPMLSNERVIAIRVNGISPLRYHIYDVKKSYDFLIGTCEVWYKKVGKVSVLKALESSTPEFLEILEVANQVICE